MTARSVHVSSIVVMGLRWCVQVNRDETVVEVDALFIFTAGENVLHVLMLTYL
jgi:hypothetical protein